IAHAHKKIRSGKSAGLAGPSRTPIGGEIIDPKTRRGGSRRISPSCRSYWEVASHLIAIMIAARGPSREIHSALGLVHRVCSPRPASSTYGGLALLPCCEPAIRSADIWSVICTPWIALRLGRFFGADDRRENSQDE